MQEVLKIKDLSIEFKNKKILEEASATFYPGDVVLIEGNNGTGKTTFLKTLIGIERKTRSRVNGVITWNDGTNVLNMDENALLKLRSQIGYLDQKDNFDGLYGITVKDVLFDSYEAFKGTLKKEDKEAIVKIFEKYKPEGASFDLKSKIHKLSGGQQRMVSIIAALCLRNNANVFIVDEPLNNLDISSIVHISNLLNRIRIENPKALFLIISHCKIFPFINKVVQLEEGRIVISQNKPVCHACFGEPNAEGYYV